MPHVLSNDGTCINGYHFMNMNEDSGKNVWRKSKKSILMGSMNEHDGTRGQVLVDFEDAFCFWAWKMDLPAAAISNGGKRQVRVVKQMCNTRWFIQKVSKGLMLALGKVTSLQGDAGNCWHSDNRCSMVSMSGCILMHIDAY